MHEHKIAVLVETEQNGENRDELIKSLTKKENDNKYTKFKNNGFSIIDKNEDTAMYLLKYGMNFM